MGMVGTLVKGALAGAVGTLAMDLLWYRRQQESDGSQDFTQWEFTDADDLDEAGAPARFAEQATDVVGVELPDEHAGAANDVVHWATGIANGMAHAVFQGGRNPLVGGALTGVTAFANSYAVLGAMGIYDPPWEYEPTALAKDLSAHMVYGVTTGLAHAALDAGRS